jgi:hypothetical protein
VLPVQGMEQWWNDDQQGTTNELGAKRVVKAT